MGRQQRHGHGLHVQICHSVQSEFERLVCVSHHHRAQWFRYFGDLLGSGSPGMGDVSLVAAVRDARNFTSAEPDGIGLLTEYFIPRPYPL